MLDWLWQQVVLTGIQIQNDVTIPHIVTALIVYSIVHTAAKQGSKRAHIVLHSPMKQRIHKHVHEKHAGHPMKCTQIDCVKEFIPINIETYSNSQ